MQLYFQRKSEGQLCTVAGKAVAENLGWQPVLDVASLGVSIAEVAINPYDPWAWAGFAGDVIYLILLAMLIGKTAKITKSLKKEQLLKLL